MPDDNDYARPGQPDAAALDAQNSKACVKRVREVVWNVHFMSAERFFHAVQHRSST